MSLNKLQFIFTECVADLLQKMYTLGYTVSFGDARAKDGHKINSLHYIGLAIDLNLFSEGIYLTKTEDHRECGIYWQTLHPQCRWGGLYNDGNHYELVPHIWR